MKATALLEQQHRKVEGLFDKLEGKGRDEGKDLVEELANDLAAHMSIEQDLFYPAVREVDAELVSEGFEEHALAEVAMRRLLVSKGDVAFKARVKALKELIQHHVTEEEHELFPKVQAALSSERLEELGEQMHQRFDELVEKGYAKLLPKGLITTSADKAQMPRRASGGRRKKGERSSATHRRRSAA